MDDKQIVDLYWARSEDAITKTADRYGKYCHYIAFHIIHNEEDSEELAEILDRFLGSLPAETRKIFMRRYWYLCSIKEIAADFRLSESKVKMALLRSRNELKALLEKEGIML